MVDKSLVNIFVLDDDPFMLKLLGHMLADLGSNRVSCFESGTAALQALGRPSRMPDVILLDINMPGMDGVEFVRHLSEKHYPGTLIFVSGEDDRMLEATAKLVRAHHLSVLGALRKPPTPEQLAKLLQEWSPPVPAMLDPAQKKTYDADALRSAIAKGELVNYYQPKVAVATGEVVGVETLVRWRHPTDGVVCPDQFIPVAEAHDLIGELTRTVLKAALVQARSWHESGIGLRVAVNVSMDNLADLEFADFVLAETAAAGVSPQFLVLEVTETRLMQNVVTALEVLTRLRLKRFTLSIDDFGIGHSSLAQLRDLPFDQLKVDRGFTHNACKDERLRAIFDNSIHLAKQLGMEVVVEGVEDADDCAPRRREGVFMN